MVVNPFSARIEDQDSLLHKVQKRNSSIVCHIHGNRPLSPGIACTLLPQTNGFRIIPPGQPERQFSGL